jgi:folate-binding protein YgfZ
MRADVAIEPAPDRRVLALMTRAAVPLDTAAAAPLLARDPRLDALGYRAVVDAATGAAQLERALRAANLAFTRVDESIYDLYRTCLGVPSDPIEIAHGVSLPAEATLDYLNAISYSKGCYVGQELTARTHFVGTTRKMLVPIIPVAAAAADGAAPPAVVAEPDTLFGPWIDSVFAPSVFGAAAAADWRRARGPGARAARRRQSDARRRVGRRLCADSARALAERRHRRCGIRVERSIDNRRRRWRRCGAARARHRAALVARAAAGGAGTESKRSVM